MPTLSSEWGLWATVNIVLGSGLVFALVIPKLNKFFPWTVEHKQSNIFLVTGFLMRGGIFLSIIFAETWGEIRWMVLGTSVYGLILLGASMVYGDKFHWRQPLAIIWFAVYLEEPLWILTLAPNSRAAVAASGVFELPGASLNPLLVGVLWLQAAIMIIAGLSMLLRIKTTSIWPWKPDIVSGLVVAAFSIGWSFWSAALAAAPSWAEASTGVLINISWLATIFISLLIFRARFDFSRRVTRVFASVNLILLVLLGAGYLLQS